jgi:hypothetical protein
VLDAIIARYMEHDAAIAELLAEGFAPPTSSASRA